MKLYHHPLSGHSHRARLFLSLINLPHELVEVDLMSGAHKTPDFLKMNPFGGFRFSTTTANTYRILTRSRSTLPRKPDARTGCPMT